MAKLLALDLGDKWVGTALSDETQIIAHPHKTVKAHELAIFLQELFARETIEVVILGYPKTMRGLHSAQTEKILAQKEQLVHEYPAITWILWDERLSSQRAKSIGTIKTKEDKQKSHSIAAAFILDSYLNYLSLQKALKKHF